MIADRQLAELAAGIYAYPGQPVVAWDFFQPESPEIPVCWGVKYVGGDTVVALRGSVTIADWLYNFDALPVDGGALGQVDGGFFKGVAESWRGIKPHVEGGLFIAGHSRGAAQAALLAAVAKADGVKASRYVGLGAPRAGFAALEDYLSDIPGRLYRAVAAGFHDPVTDVPLPLLELPYVHVRPLIDVHVTITEAARRDLGPFSIHYAPGYAAALP